MIISVIIFAVIGCSIGAWIETKLSGKADAVFNILFPILLFAIEILIVIPLVVD